jgi:hypothetical protein
LLASTTNQEESESERSASPVARRPTDKLVVE